MIPLKIQLLVEDQIPVIPRRMTEGSVGLDVCSSYYYVIEQDRTIMISLGFKMEIPQGYYAMLLPRSSLHKKDLILVNSVGIIDSDYRDEVRMLLRNVGPQRQWIDQFERVGQLIIMPYPNVSIEVGEVSRPTTRKGGFGSTNV